MDELLVTLSRAEFHVIGEALQDALDDDRWSQEWKNRVRPVRERFRAATRQLGDLDLAHDELEYNGVKVVRL